MTTSELTGLDIPDDWPVCEADWLTAALQHDFPGCRVDSVNLVLHDDGTNRRARFGVVYSEGVGPSTVFIKASDPTHAKLNAATGGILNEARLFAQRPDLPVDHPAVYCSIFDEPSLAFVMVMEDIAGRGGQPCDSTRPLSIDQAASGVRALAALHSAFWGTRLTARRDLAWVESYTVWKMKMERGIEIGLERTANLLPMQVKRMTAREIESGHWTDFIGTLSTGPQTLLHGDAHVGNTYALPDGHLGFLDWQVLRRGHPSIDLGYFVQGAVTLADRRAHERDLVAMYRSALDVPDTERPTWDTLWARYRASTAHGLALWLATAASDAWQRREVSFALVERYAAAFNDLGSAEALAALR